MPYKSEQNKQQWYLKNKEKADTKSRRWKELHPERAWAFNLKRYGISASDYLWVLDVQGGVCAICKRPPKGKRLAVDHDHKTGKVRGLLCSKCNTLLGNADDQPLILLSAVEYLRLG